MTTSTDVPASLPERGQTVPDFFIVGHHKSGTTALYEMLRRHPQIFMPSLKEPRYLAGDLRALVPSTPSQPATLDQYLALFSEAAPWQRVGEASPSYLRSREAARAIAALQPGARIIAIFREPASFVRSLHLQLLQEHVETERDLAAAVAGEQRQRAGQTVLRYSDHVRYAEQLRRYHEVFPREQVLTLIYEEFRADNEAALRSVLRFLEVDEDVPLTAVEANPSVSVRAPRLDGALRSLRGRTPLARAARSTLTTLLPRGPRRRALAVLRRRVLYEEPPPADEQVMLALRRRYAPEVRAFGEYLGRDMVDAWGYQDLV
ncbi:MAG TPA: sulfotransferase [Solirubrobacteraceae bacterium]|nr:sulfotransferase [Solirubrobacteraceae bacterium]